MDIYRPNFLTELDFPWLSKLVSIFQALEGYPAKAVDDRMHEDDVAESCRANFKRAKNYLHGLMTAKLKTSDSKKIRLEYFSKIFSLETPPTSSQYEDVALSTAKSFGLTTSRQLRQELLADMNDESCISLPEEPLDPSALANEINLIFIKSLLRRAESVEISMKEQSRRVVRVAKLQGLICEIKKDLDEVKLYLSGPLSLHCKTNIYGHAFSSLASIMPWCGQYQLTAKCHHDNRVLSLKIQTGDPIKPSQIPKLFDSKIEEKIAKSILKKFPEWQAFREPTPLETSEGIMFPDFLIQNRLVSDRKFYCEIIGWWTSDYLTKKIRQWAFIQNSTDIPFVLCVSKSLCTEKPQEIFPQSVLLFKKNIDPKELMRLGELLSEKMANITN